MFNRRTHVQNTREMYGNAFRRIGVFATYPAVLSMNCNNCIEHNPHHRSDDLMIPDCNPDPNRVLPCIAWICCPCVTCPTVVIGEAVTLSLSLIAVTSLGISAPFVFAGAGIRDCADSADVSCTEACVICCVSCVGCALCMGNIANNAGNNPPPRNNQAQQPADGPVSLVMDFDNSNDALLPRRQSSSARRRARERRENLFQPIDENAIRKIFYGNMIEQSKYCIDQGYWDLDQVEGQDPEVLLSLPALVIVEAINISRQKDAFTLPSGEILTRANSGDLYDTLIAPLLAVKKTLPDLESKHIELLKISCLKVNATSDELCQILDEKYKKLAKENSAELNEKLKSLLITINETATMITRADQFKELMPSVIEEIVSNKANRLKC